ncbi:unnamed protein product [Penicillium salamii]|nr:unnamed protein product [Penicillium salamii]
MFKSTQALFGGLLWKTPWRLSSPQKARQRKRLRSVDRVVDTLGAALERNGQTSKAITRWYAEMPREEEMLPKDKYTLFDKKEKSYRKSIHSMFSIVDFTTEVPLARLHPLITFLLQSFPNGLVSASVSTLPDSKRIFTTPYMYNTSEIRLWRGTCRSEKQHMDYRSFGFWTCSEANLKKMVAYNVPLLLQRLDQAFNSNAFRQYSAEFRTPTSPEDTNNEMPMAW